MDYDLPGDTAYAETCASIGLIFFARRMLELDPKGQYGDVMSGPCTTRCWRAWPRTAAGSST